MSRGPGRVQRAVLDVLAEECNSDGWLTVPELAGRVVGPDSTRAEHESVRRAAKRLARAGRVELEYFDAPVDVRSARVSWGDWIVYRRRHDGYRRVLAVHWPLSVEERAARAKLQQDWLDRLTTIDARISGEPT